MKVTKFSKQNLPMIRQDLDKILKAYADANGFTISIGNIRFSDGEFKAQLETKIVGAVTKSDKILDQMMEQYSLGQIGIGGRELVGVNPRAYGYPFQYIQGGKRFKCSVESAKLYFGK